MWAAITYCLGALSWTIISELSFATLLTLVVSGQVLIIMYEDQEFKAKVKQTGPVRLLQINRSNVRDFDPAAIAVVLSRPHFRNNSYLSDFSFAGFR
jgi:hypothetical protein